MSQSIDNISSVSHSPPPPFSSHTTLLKIVQTTPTNRLSQAFYTYLESLTQPQRYAEINVLFDTAQEVEELLAQAVNLAWLYLIQNNVWSVQFPNLDAYLTSIHFHENLQPILLRNQDIATRRDGTFRTLMNTWHRTESQLFPPDIQPSSISNNLARNLGQLSALTSWDIAMHLIRQQIQIRLDPTNPNHAKHTRTTTTVLPIDVTNAFLALKADPASSSIASTSNDSQQSPSPTSTLSESDLPAPSPGSSLHHSSSQLVPFRRDFNPQQALYSVVIPVRSTLNRSQYYIDPNTDAPLLPPGTSSSDPPPCSCPSTVRHRINRIRYLIQRYTQDEKFTFATTISDLTNDFESICWNHIRILGRETVGLLSNGVVMTEYKNRLTAVLSEPSQYDFFREQQPTCFWFNASTRLSYEVDALAPFKFQPIPDFLPEPEIFPKQIFDRFAGPGYWERFLIDGTIIIPDVFSYLYDDPVISDLIDYEFEMYQHHFHVLPAHATRGFLRNMFYSSIQQLVRQDPLWYALHVAARPDTAWKLISYPYVAKYAMNGDKTGFIHMDINIKDFIESGTDGSKLTSSLSLDNEDHSNCTVVVPGFHNHISAWYERRKSRPNVTQPGVTTEAEQSYLPEDEQSFGKAIPTPCPKAGVRITLPNVIHGSTPFATKTRRTIYPWLTSIAADHIELSTPGQHTWPQVSDLHRDLVAPTRGVGGEQVTRDRPSGPFPPQPALRGCGYISDALIGVRRWDDPNVVADVMVLLGEDDDNALAIVTNTRHNLLEQYRNCMRSVIAAEQLAYEANSYGSGATNPFARHDEIISSEQSSGDMSD